MRDEVTLTALAQAHVPHAVDAVVAFHRPRVQGQVPRLRISRDDQPHYESIGAEALARRLASFDPARGVHLWGYARKRGEAR